MKKSFMMEKIVPHKPRIHSPAPGIPSNESDSLAAPALPNPGATSPAKNQYSE
jgi:hypothetical protein